MQSLRNKYFFNTIIIPTIKRKNRKKIIQLYSNQTQFIIIEEKGNEIKFTSNEHRAD